MPKAKADDLLFVSKSHKDRLDMLSAGASLVARTGYEVGQLGKSCLDRIKLAVAFYRDAVALQAAPGILKRSVISRAYYAMYHAARSATYIDFGGDDHEAHTSLPTKLPADFPDRMTWQNKLKNARLERNRADYDPYPRRDESFRKISASLVSDAEKMIYEARTYIKSKAP